MNLYVSFASALIIVSVLYFLWLTARLYFLMSLKNILSSTIRLYGNEYLEIAGTPTLVLSCMLKNLSVLHTSDDEKILSDYYFEGYRDICSLNNGECHSLSDKTVLNNVIDCMLKSPGKVNSIILALLPSFLLNFFGFISFKMLTLFSKKYPLLDLKSAVKSNKDTYSKKIDSLIKLF